MAEEKVHKTGVIGVEYRWEKPIEEMLLYDKPEYNIARITIDRPQKLNCWIEPEMTDYLLELLDQKQEEEKKKKNEEQEESK